MSRNLFFLQVTIVGGEKASPVWEWSPRLSSPNSLSGQGPGSECPSGLPGFGHGPLCLS